MVAVVAIFVSNVPEGLSSSIAALSSLAALAGCVLFRGLPPGLVAATTATAAGAILAMLSDTMIPEAFAQTHDHTGLITVIGFLASFALTKLGGR